MKERVSESYNQIIKSTGIVSIAQFVIILIGILRSKIIAILLGPEGVGIFGIFQSTLSFIQGATGFGISFSGVRDVAEATGSGNKKKISTTVHTLKRWGMFTGLLGAVFTLAFCKTLSRIAFGDYSHAWGFAVLSLSLFFGSISNSQIALLQGLRKITMMSKANVIGIFLGFLFSIPLYYFLGNQGIVLSLLVVSMVTLSISWWYIKKIKFLPTSMSIKETFLHGKNMIKLGFFTVIATLASTGTMFILRIFIVSKSDVELVGIFQASWTLSTVYLAAVLGAMGADYFPRLSEVSTDNEKMNKLANEQTEIAMLVSTPLMVTILSFASIIISLFYSQRFGSASPILQWQVLGTFLKVLSWPLAYILMAKGKGLLYIIGELLFNISYIIMVYFGWGRFSLEITGIGFLISYLVYILYIVSTIAFVTRFRFSRANRISLVLYSVILVSTFILVKTVTSSYIYILLICFIAVTALISFLRLRRLVDIKALITSAIHRFSEKRPSNNK